MELTYAGLRYRFYYKSVDPLSLKECCCKEFQTWKFYSNVYNSLINVSLSSFLKTHPHPIHSRGCREVIWKHPFTTIATSAAALLIKTSQYIRRNSSQSLPPLPQALRGTTLSLTSSGDWCATVSGLLPNLKELQVFFVGPLWRRMLRLRAVD